MENEIARKDQAPAQRIPTLRRGLLFNNGHVTMKVMRYRLDVDKAPFGLSIRGEVELEPILHEPKNAEIYPLDMLTQNGLTAIVQFKSGTITIKAA